jgi:2-polyprenyl-6-methoxyphenol hydroxylase-like FAD-dependent oxidoreductase
MSIHLIIIGAGLAGLSAGISTKVANPNHQVTILESVKELAEIGVSLRPPFHLTVPRPITRAPAAIETQLTNCRRVSN